MDFTPTEDRRMLADMIGRFVREQYPLETRHLNAGLEEGFSREAWRQFAELGVVGALLSEEAGGFGGGGFDIMTVFQELGRGLVVEPFLSSAVLGAGALLRSRSPAHKVVVERVIAGDTLLAFAHGEPDSRYDLADVQTTAVPAGSGWSISGTKAVVLNGGSADHLVVSARLEGGRTDEAGIALFVVDAGAEGVARRAYGTIDGGQACEISFDNVAAGPDDVVGDPGNGLEIIEAVNARAILAVCAEALGAMEAARDLTLEYLGTRKQFGQPIGGFQALQHRMADMLTEIEQVRSAVINAAGHLDAPRRDREIMASAAKNLIGRVGRLVAEETIQLHGGIGMTWEYSLPHYAKRLVMIDHQFGDTDHHLERFMALSASASDS